tara:strand:+ start:6290 stop:7021 length:732 start_codon:yes stop_codon:yes gene_type:complete
MSITDARYSFRFQGPEMVEQGRNNLIQCPAYIDGALAEPVSGTITIWNSAGQEVVTAGVVVVTATIATYNLTTVILAAEELSEGWVFEWSLLMPDGIVHTARNDGANVRCRLYPDITDADIFRRESALDPDNGATITSLADFQDYIDEADVEVQLRLRELGNRPNLIVSSSALRQTWLFLVLSLIFEDLSSRLNEAYSRKAEHYRAAYERAFNSANFLYDTDDDGTPDDPTDRKAARPTVWLS